MRIRADLGRLGHGRRPHRIVMRVGREPIASIALPGLSRSRISTLKCLSWVICVISDVLPALPRFTSTPDISLHRAK